MVEPLILEVLDRRERVVQRVQLDHLPITIGRALTNHVVLDDRYVCPVHARIGHDDAGKLVAEDLDSVNGLWADRRTSRVALSAGVRLRIGHTALRVRSADEVLPPTLVDRSGGRPRLLAYWPTAVAACVAALLAIVLQAYLESHASEGLRAATGIIALQGLVVVTWSTGWAFVNRVIGQQWNLLPHLATAAAFWIALQLVGSLFEYLEFLSIAPRAVEVAGSVLIALLFAALLNGHLSLCSPLPVPRRRMTALLTAALLVGGIEVLTHIQKDEFSAELEHSSALKPVPAAWLPTRSVESFVNGLEGLRDEVDALAATRP